MTDFGGTLREARERRGISLGQIAASTKISTTALEALERNDVSRLPGGIFSRAFVRSYAVAVGLDPEATLREFLQAFTDERPRVSAPTFVPAAGIPFEPRTTRAGALFRVALVSLLVVGVLAYFFLHRRQAVPPWVEQASPREDPSAVRDAPAPAAAGPALPPLPEHTSAAAGSSLPASPGFRLEIHPSGPCWISLTVDGRRVLSRLVNSGERLPFQVLAQAVLEVGDAGAFEYTVNGRPGRTLGEAGQVRTARINSASLSEHVR
ncbi:helix-turn-helix domain-containing protein [soil metagenome]